MKTIDKMDQLHVDDFFHIMNDLAINNYSDVHLDADWYKAFVKVSEQDAGTRISEEDKAVLLGGLVSTEEETLKYLLNLVGE